MEKSKKRTLKKLKTAIRVVMFDVDGVLLDSLPQHLQICTDKALEYGLNDVFVPTPPEFRQRVASGVKVSPMHAFFESVGFPSKYAERAVVDYERDFSTNYPSPLFGGIENLMRELRSEDVTLGLVTSNTKGNVEPILKPLLHFFDPRCLFYFEGAAKKRSKASCLSQSSNILQQIPSTCIYVGDQPTDKAASDEAQWNFLGVTYGWGIQHGTSTMTTVDTVEEMTRYLKQRAQPGFNLK